MEITITKKLTCKTCNSEFIGKAGRGRPNHMCLSCNEKKLTELKLIKSQKTIQLCKTCGNIIEKNEGRGRPKQTCVKCSETKKVQIKAAKIEPRKNLPPCKVCGLEFDRKQGKGRPSVVCDTCKSEGKIPQKTEINVEVLERTMTNVSPATEYNSIIGENLLFTTLFKKPDSIINCGSKVKFLGLDEKGNPVVKFSKTDVSQQPELETSSTSWKYLYVPVYEMRKVEKV